MVSLLEGLFLNEESFVLNSTVFLSKDKLPELGRIFKWQI
jgi:hypothetical protein